jgi:hypothetical protein
LAKTMGERVFYVLFAPKLKLVNFWEEKYKEKTWI